MESLSRTTRWDLAATLLTVMSNRKRLLVLGLLVEREISVGELAQAVGLRQSALSQHLSKLRMLRLVKTRRQAQVVYYSCSSEAVHAVLKTLDTLFISDKDVMDEPISLSIDKKTLSNEHPHVIVAAVE